MVHFIEWMHQDDLKIKPKSRQHTENISRNNETAIRVEFGLEETKQAPISSVFSKKIDNVIKLNFYALYDLKVINIENVCSTEQKNKHRGLFDVIFRDKKHKHE